MDVLGISCYYHDAAAALVRDGVVIAAAEEERFSRRKHDHGFPRNAIDFCLRRGGVRSDALDYVVFYEKPFVKFERLVKTVFASYPRTAGLFQEAVFAWAAQKLWIKQELQRSLAAPEDRILFVDHHLSHAASAFYCSPFERAAILTVDGVGEWTTSARGAGDGLSLRLTEETRFPHSVGLFYSAFTAFLGFEVNEGEYKVMGMAPYGTPKYVDRVREVIQWDERGGVWLDLRYFSHPWSLTRMFSPRFESLFGRPRRPEDRDVMDPYYLDLAASVQAVTEEVMLAMARNLHQETGLSSLCMAGGVALNSVANGRIRRETPFTSLYIQPAAGDSGGAVGAALYVTHAVLGRPRGFVMEHAYWGDEHGDACIEAALRAEGAAFTRWDDDEALLSRVAESLAAGKVAGWYQGRFEWGPRALGNRSILADPRHAGMKDTVNLKVKFREPFRPFAPAVLAERARDYFDIADPAEHPARFMLLVAPVRKERRAELQATTHVDGSARLQTVFPEANPRYHRLIQRFGEATGVPVLLNTSFNLKGEPIVNTPADALSSFRRSGLDLLAMGRYLVEKK